MQLAFCSISALDRSITQAAKVAAGAGLHAIEVTARPPHLVPADGIEAARQVGRAVRAAGVDVVAYGSYLGLRGRLTGKHAEEDVAIARALDTRLLRAWAEPFEEGQSDPAPTVELMQAACDAARDDDVTVVIERHVGSFADTPERIEALFRAIDRPNVALNYQVLDFLPAAAIPGQAADAAELIHFAKYCHLKNYQNPGGDGPLFPGGSLEHGVLDYHAILGAILDAGYDGPMTIEFLAADERPVEEKLAQDVAFVRRVLAQR